MNDYECFETLECANAQIDVWIDEEEYDRVINSCEIDVELKVDEEKKKTLQEMFESAFSNESCTAKNDAEWLSILNHSSCPISVICNIPQEGDRIDLVSPDYDAWSRFFWAKLIRARIQQKGTDCYYRRLDEVVAYLERYRPPIKPAKQSGTDKQESDSLSNQMAVIYLLEMAASGERADQRSFADRARRIINDKFKDTDFGNFYDLLARYNIGVGYFHEGSYRKAAREFNWIISKLQKKWTKNGRFNRSSGKNGKFIDDRMGRELLYVPVVLYRSEIQLKLQLAYHAQGTLASYLDAPTEYKEAKSNIIKAEAYQQMGRQNQAWQALRRAYQFSKDSPEDLGHREDVRSFTAKPGEKLANLRGRLQNLAIAAHLEFLEKYWLKMAAPDLREYVDKLNKFFEEYKISAEYQKSNRIGYFEQIAEYLALLSKNVDEKTEDSKDKQTIFKNEAKKVYNRNKEDDILIQEKDDWSCPCMEKGIDLRRLDPEHYEGFSKNMRTFFEVMGNSIQKDKQEFLRRLQKLEEDSRSNLEWRKRELDLEINENIPRASWCEGCIPKAQKELGFGGLLRCSGPTLEDHDKKLWDKDYEKIMDHWDYHFLEHMRDVSFHEPSRCRAIHFLGLQRWNSSSPAQGQSLGGGYLIYHTDKGCVDLGVAVDPGFDFVRNLFHVGYSLSDIDVVLLSHAHVDHVRDFESMITLLLELRNREKIARKLHTIMTLGVYRRLEYLIESPGLREFVEPYIVDIEKEIDDKFLYNCKFEFMPDPSEAEDDGVLRPRFMPVLPDRRSNRELCLEITPTKAYHNDYSEYSDSFGFVIKIQDPKAEPRIEYTLGYTGDTSWNDDIMKHYRNKSCDALLVHLGSLIDREKQERKKFQHYKSHKECFKLIREKNHPYLMGMLHFLTEIDGWKHRGKKPLVLMSEFGEEMRGKIRLDFIKRLKKAYPDTFNVLPVDIGLDVLLAEGKSEECEHSRPLLEEGMPKVWCVRCKDFVSLEQAAFEHYGHDEALFCVCRTCQKATPPDVLQERLRALYEIGRRLETGRQK